MVLRYPNRLGYATTFFNYFLPPVNRVERTSPATIAAVRPFLTASLTSFAGGVMMHAGTDRAASNFSAPS